MSLPPGQSPKTPSPARTSPAASSGPAIALVVLAAGRSSRMQGRHKLLEEIGGTPIVHHVVRRALDATLGPVIVVTGHQSDSVQAALSDLPVTFAFAADYADGMSASLRCGLNHCPSTVSGAMILLADMPELSVRHLQSLYGTWAAAAPPAIAMTRYNGRRGNPVLWDRAYFPALQRLEGDTGGRALLADHAASLVVADLSSDPEGAAALTDIDTPADLLALRSRLTD